MIFSRKGGPAPGLELRPATMDELLTSLAPPALAGRAADIANPRKWIDLARHGAFAWGRFRGSQEYSVAVDTETPRFKCDCPTRTVPCKHALALYALAVRQRAALDERPLPPEIAAWQTAPKASSRALPTDASREAREELISAGIDDLERWLRDLVRGGLAALPARPYAAVEEPARRLIDAKAPGLAGMLRDLGASAASGTGWQERVVHRLGRLHLLIEAWRRRDSLPDDLRADVTALVGVTVYQQAVLARPAVADQWWIIGEQITEDDNRRTLRTWLWGRRTQRPALILQFEFYGQQLDRALMPGHLVDAALCYYPSAWPLRAVVQTKSPLQAMRDAPGMPSLKEMHAAFGHAIACQPWIESIPVPLAKVTVERRDDALWLTDGVHEVAVAPWFAHGWPLLAISGGQPVTLFGEWDGRRYLPLSAWTGERLVAFS